MSKNSFNEQYENEAIESIDFDISWNNGTGYYDNSTNIELEPGKVVKSYDENTKRKLILVGTRYGTVTVFERYANASRGIYMCNTPHLPDSFKETLGLRSSLSQDTICSVIGTPGMRHNIGTLIEDLMKFDKFFGGEKE